MKYALLLLTCMGQSLFCASEDGPVKVGMPNELVAAIFTNVVKRAVENATALNDNTPPKGDIADPYLQIAEMGLLPFMKQHEKMIPDSEVYINKINASTALGDAISLATKAHDKPMVIRKGALEIICAAANVPLAEEEKSIIPQLHLSIMTGIMLQNQKLTLSDEQKDLWRAAFAAEASIYTLMDDTDSEAFIELYKPFIDKEDTNDIPNAPSNCTIL